MQKDIPKPVIAGIISVVVILVLGLGFVLLRDKPPTTAVNTKGREQLGPPPAKTEVPDWVKKKLQGSSG